MFFILAQLLSFFLKPISWIGFLFIASFLFKNSRIKRNFRISAIFTFLLCTNFGVINFLMNKWEGNPTALKNLEKHDVVVILTGCTMYKLPEDRVHFGKGADRLLHPYLLYKKGLIKNFLITGGVATLTKQNKAESVMLKNALLDYGVPDSVIFIEDKSNNTYENAKFSKPILEKHFKNKKILLVTSAFHMRRSTACFEKQGIKHTTFSADFYAKEMFRFQDFFAPQSEALLMWDILLHEISGIAIYKLSGYL